MLRQLLRGTACRLEPVSIKALPVEIEERVEKLAETKAKGQEVILPEEPVQAPPVVDLMEALRASVEQARSRRDQKPTKRAAQGGA